MFKNKVVHKDFINNPISVFTSVYFGALLSSIMYDTIAMYRKVNCNI